MQTSARGFKEGRKPPRNSGIKAMGAPGDRQERSTGIDVVMSACDPQLTALQTRACVGQSHDAPHKPFS